MNDQLAHEFRASTPSTDRRKRSQRQSTILEECLQLLLGSSSADPCSSHAATDIAYTLNSLEKFADGVDDVLTKQELDFFGHFLRAVEGVNDVLHRDDSVRNLRLIARLRACIGKESDEDPEDRNYAQVCLVLGQVDFFAQASVWLVDQKRVGRPPEFVKMLVAMEAARLHQKYRSDPIRVHEHSMYLQLCDLLLEYATAKVRGDMLWHAKRWRNCEPPPDLGTFSRKLRLIQLSSRLQSSGDS